MSANDPYRAPAQSSPGYPVAPQAGIKNVLFSFSGRIPRRTFWLYYLVTLVAAGVIMGIASALFISAPVVDPASSSALGSSAAAAAAQPSINPLFYIFALVVYIPTIWIGLALQAKRWHDRGKSAWWILIGLIPLIGGIWAFVEAGCLRGTVGPNQYGQDPT